MFECEHRCAYAWCVTEGLGAFAVGRRSIMKMAMDVFGQLAPHSWHLTKHVDTGSLNGFHAPKRREQRFPLALADARNVIQ